MPALPAPCAPRLVALLLVALPPGVLADAAIPSALLDAAADHVVARAVVPNKLRRQGEVRLVTRGNATVVQTLLATKVPSRVVAEIRKKEERNWPAGVPGHDDMRRYTEAVAATAAQLRAADGDEDDRRIHLFIELVASTTDGGIAIGEWEGEEIDGRIAPRSRRTIATPDVGRPYLLRNMRLILADAFDLDEDDVGRLGPLGPAAPGDPSRPRTEDAPPAR